MNMYNALGGNDFYGRVNQTGKDDLSHCRLPFSQPATKPKKDVSTLSPNHQQKVNKSTQIIIHQLTIHHHVFSHCVDVVNYKTEILGRSKFTNKKFLLAIGKNTKSSHRHVYYVLAPL